MHPKRVRDLAYGLIPKERQDIAVTDFGILGDGGRLANQSVEFEPLRRKNAQRFLPPSRVHRRLFPTDTSSMSLLLGDAQGFAQPVDIIAFAVRFVTHKEPHFVASVAPQACVLAMFAHDIIPP